ncbi:MAG: TM2 domain-containing protein [Bacteroidota bacterium]
MKKTLILLSVLLLIGASMNTQAGNYRIDQNRVDRMMTTASSIDALSVFSLPDFAGLPDNTQLTATKDPMIALVLCLLLGWVGGHRYYLGTEFKICIFYALLSLIGVGFILVTIDAVMLLMAGINKSDMKGYINNPKLIMWKDQL